MKLRDFLDYMERQGCVMRREGAKHTVFFNPENGASPPIAGIKRPGDSGSHVNGSEIESGEPPANRMLNLLIKSKK
jgi:hypothetical protein